MAIVKNNFRISRLKGEISPKSKESMSTDEDELQKHSSASDYDEDDEAGDDNEEEDEEEDVDSGMDSDDVDLSELGEVKEELCQVGNQICSVPFELYDLKGLSDILSVDVWNECLTEEERFGLAKYLPDMDQESFLRTMKELFSGGNFHFGSPLVKLFDMLKGGSCEPRVMLYQHGWNFFQKFRHYHNLRKYQNSMVGKFVQINKTWLSCKGYSIEERLRVLNVTRSQRNLLGDKREDMGLESDSSGREELGDGSYTRKLKETHGSKMGYVGSPTVDTMVRYGKPNPKGILKLPGSKGSSVEGLTGAYPPRSYNSPSAFPQKELIPGYHSGTARQSKSVTKVALPRNREVFSNEPLIGVPLSVHAQRKNWNADQITEMATRLERGSPDFPLRDAGKKSKFDRSPHTSVEDRTYNGNGRPQPPMSKFIPLDRSLGNQSYHPLAAKEEVFSEDWDIRGDKWKVRPEFQNNANRVGFDTKFRRYGSPQPHLNDRFSPSGQKTMKSQKKIKRESMQNGFDLEEFSQSDETESDSSEQLHEGNHSRSNLGYPSGSLEGHGKNNKLAKKEKLYDNSERLHLQDVDMYTLKGKQKGKVQDPRYLHGYATGISEESGFPMSGNDGRRGYKSLKADQMQSEQYQPYSSGKKKKGQVDNEYHGYSRDYIEEDSSPVYLDDPGRVNRVVKKGQPLDAHATGRHERANMPILECSTSSKKRKGKSDMPYMSGLGESDVYYSPQQQVDDSPSLKKRGKRETEMDSDSLAMVNVEQVVVDVEPETKPGKKPFILITPSTHTGFSFSIIHLLSAVRIALVTPLTEDALAITNYNGNAEQNGKHDTLNGGTSISDQTRGTNLPALTVHEIVNRVKSNPGDPAILETQEPLQDLVRGVLKIFSSKTAPLGAKGWKALVSYEKPIKSWSWIGPVSSSAPDPDMVEEVTSCESWNLPHKMLVKLVDSFANWLKNGQETLQQIGSLPAPPLILMQPNLDEKERFRDLRAQKSLTTISPSTEEVRAYFRREEILRYSVPDRAFSYTAADGRKSIVAPLRRGGGKPTSKARDHPILKPDRPPHVTILCLVRDAAARLPGSIGTRADVCMLIRDSQYIVEDVTDAQVNQVVSGALDRLHYERDPCVQFDSERKLWVYLHRDREEEDFEDDGTSSTKKWKRPRKDASEQSDNATPNVAYQEQTTSGFGGGTVTTTYEIIDPLSMQPGERMDLIYQGNTGSYMASEQGRLHQGGRPVDWSLNSLPENNMLCLENSTNEDYDEPFRRDRRFSASINNGVT